MRSRIVFKWRIFSLMISLFAGADSIGQSFVNVAAEIGIDHLTIDENHVCGGVILLDINNDNYLDIYAPGGQADDHVYLNDQHGGFIDITETSGLNIERAVATCGGTAGDFDRDGFQDLFITTDQGFDNYLFRNNGDNSFIDVSEASGIRSGDSIWSSSATFVDINLDGHLDLYVGNYLTYRQKPFRGLVEPNSGLPNDLYINNGDGTFSEKSEAYGLSTRRATLAVAAYDINGDHLPDLLEGNDFGQLLGANEIYINDTARDTLIAAGAALNLDPVMYCMGIAGGDYNNDLYTDFFFTDYFGEKYLLATYSQNESNDCPEFNYSSGITRDQDRYIQWGTVFVDYNNDSDLDLIVSTGNLTSEKELFFFENDQGNLTDVTESFNLSDMRLGRGLATGDYDNDGDMDLFWANNNNDDQTDHKLVVYRNDLSSDHNWIKFKLRGTYSNPDSYHTKVYVHYGNATMLRYVDGGSSFLSKHETILTVGLGTATQVDSVTLVWPNGTRQIEKNLLVNTLNEITEIPADTREIALDPDCFRVKEENPPLGISKPHIPGTTWNLNKSRLRIASDDELLEIRILDASGKELCSQNLAGKTYETDLSAYHGVLIIHLSTAQSYTVNKFWLP